ncbi:hypothetical protein BDN72DRAFT_956848 [Pluteus cervinus]|uniref:Uncharacterized protein n=1 Tax=Pluteus cervinus TaxID=181527 RepID=A0ACD3B5X3_9AGAR|nr:hypothetical protein BDN72DRAFT_956848 [Pluteus cervinus]
MDTLSANDFLDNGSSSSGGGEEGIGGGSQWYERPADDGDVEVGRAFETVTTQSGSREPVFFIPIVFMDPERESFAEIPAVGEPAEIPVSTDSDSGGNDQAKDTRPVSSPTAEVAAASPSESGIPPESSTTADGSNLSEDSTSSTEASQPPTPTETIQSTLQSDELQTSVETEGPTTLFTPSPTFSSTVLVVTSSDITPLPSSTVMPSLAPIPSSFSQTSLPESTVTIPQSPTSSLLVATTPLSTITSSPTPSEQATPSARPTRSDTNSADAATTSQASNPAALATRGPQFYVAVVLGAIFGITCIAAIAAWFIRVRSHTRRKRHEEEIVASVFGANTPRAERGDGGYGGGFEHGYLGQDGDTGHTDGSIHRFGRGVTMGGFRGLQSIEEVSESGSLGQRGGGYHAASGDSHLPSLAFLPAAEENVYAINHLGRYSGSNPVSSFETEVRSALHLEEPAPAHFPNPYTTNSSTGTLHDMYTLGRWQVTNMMPEDILSSSDDDRRRSRERLLSGQEYPHFTGTPSDLVYGTPRESYPGMTPRYLGVEGHGLRVPWQRKHEPITDVRRHEMGLKGEKEDWVEGRGIPTDAGKAREHWAGALKSNLVNAFNAVAAGLSGVSPMPGHEGKHKEPEDIYTRRPLRRQGSSLRDLDRGTSALGSANLQIPALSRNGSATSYAWSPEETKDGAGVVHIRHRGPTGGSFSRTIGNNTIRQTDVWARRTGGTIDTAAKPCPSFLKPGERRSPPDEELHVPDRPDMVARGSSIYSASSTRSSMFGYPSSSGEEGAHLTEGIRATGTSRANSTRTGAGPSGKLTPRASRKRPKVRRPSVVHRTSSSSISAYPAPERSNSILSQLRGKELMAMRALQDRHRRARRTIKSKIT